MPHSPGRTHDRGRLRCGLLGAAAVVLAAGSLGAGTADATADDPDKPDVNRHGEAYMGWSTTDDRADGDRAPRSTRQEKVPGLDVSGHQGTVDWQHAWDDGARFAY
ncbi:MAG: hypothetical protein GEV09_25715, partial [Pseudonocardiaceae bacterium]|nr:hypothetical protein [Pseudonocardiaceae bacterium]